MPFSLLPKIIANRLTDITPELLHARGIRLLMLDFDNTIVPYTTDVPTAEMTAWLDRMKQTDITVCIVSNSHTVMSPFLQGAWSGLHHPREKALFQGNPGVSGEI